MAKLNINGQVRVVQVEPDTPLLWVIREQVGLTGTKYGCGIAQCGACSVHINGEVMRSCSIRVGDVKASDKIVTIEGLSATSSHPVQKAWAAIDVPQCGYCQSGQIMAAAALLKKTPKPTDKDIDEAMTNICRCGTYQRIRAAVHMAAGMGNGGNRPTTPPRSPKSEAREVRHDKEEFIQQDFVAKLSRRTSWSALRRRGRRPGARFPPAARCRFGASRSRRRRRGQCLGRHQAGRHLHDPHRAHRDGPGHPHRPRPARRRRTAMRLEEGDDRLRSPPGQNLARKRVWGEMGTGGSRGIRTSQDYVRRGGAAARMMLLQAAADQWKVPVEELTVSDGVITHAASQALDELRQDRGGRRQADAARPEEHHAARIPRSWTIAGKPMKRLDTADKLNGSKIYAIDLKLPGMLCAAIKDCPVFGGTVKSYDEAKIASRPGVSGVVKVKDNAVAVVADTWWRAKSALEALPIEWDDGPNAAASSATIAAHLRRRLRRGRPTTAAARTAMPSRRSQRRGQEGRGDLLDAVPRPRHHGADELHGEDLRRPRPKPGCRHRTPRPRSLRSRKPPASRSTNARSTGPTSAAASAGAAARRTMSIRPSPSPRTSPTFRSS